MKLSIAIIIFSSALLATSSAFAPVSPGAGRSSARSHAALMSSLADAPAPAENAADSDEAAASAQQQQQQQQLPPTMMRRRLRPRQQQPRAATTVDVAAGDRQKLYGQGLLDLPETYAMCGRCKTAYALQPDDLGTRGKGRYVLSVVESSALKCNVHICEDASVVVAVTRTCTSCALFAFRKRGILNFFFTRVFVFSTLRLVLGLDWIRSNKPYSRSFLPSFFIL